MLVLIRRVPQVLSNRNTTVIRASAVEYKECRAVIVSDNMFLGYRQLRPLAATESNEPSQEL